MATLAGQFDLTVALPPGYRADGRVRYPAMYLLSGGLTFSLVWATQHFLTFDDALEPVVLVGVRRVTSSLSEALCIRFWDFTPWVDSVFAKTSEPDSGCRSGGADSLLLALAQSLPLLIDRLYATDRSDRGLMGHWLSGHFGVHVLLNHPGLFSRYLLNEPFLVFSYTQLVQRLAALPSERPVATRLFLSGVRSGIPDLPRLAALAPERRALGATEFILFEGESHNSVVPAAISRGLRWRYGRPR